MRRALREAGILGAFVLLTVAMTWPWAAHVRDTSFDPGDSYLNAWTLAWDFRQTFRDPVHLFDANIFYPYRGTLALSEHQWGTALLFFPAFAAGLAPLTVHGLAMLFAFAFSGYGAFRLARTLTGSTLAGWVAGVAFAFVPYRFHHLPHLQYVHAGWMALLAEAVVLFARRRTWSVAAWLGAAFLMSGLSSIHWFVLGALPVLATVLLVLRESPRGERRTWLRALAALAAASVVLLPFLLPYVRAGRAYGFARAYEEVATYSARLVDWITPDWNVKVWQGSGLGSANPEGEFCLFPGLVLFVLAAIGCAAAFRRKDAAARTGLVWAALGFLGSLGTRTPFHAALYLALPPFRAIRVPARWAMVADLGLALLAAAAVLGLVSRLRRPGARALTGAAGCVLLLFEDRVAPLYLHRGEPDPDALTRALAPTPMKGGLFQLPDHFGETNARYVLRAADHWKPLVNAYSGFQTPLAKNLHDLLLESRTAELLDALEKVPVSYVTVRTTRMPESQRAQVAALVADGVASRRLLFIRTFRPGDDLYAVTRNEPDARPLAPPEAADGDLAPGGRPFREDPELTGSLDDPSEDATVRGALTVKGWARIPGEDLAATVLIDGEARAPLSALRAPRLEVCVAIPRLGPDCSTAGYEATLPFVPGDEGEHDLAVRFRSKDGRERHYPARKFVWKP